MRPDLVRRWFQGGAGRTMAEAHGWRVLDRLDDPFVHLFTPPLSGSREAVVFRDGQEIRRMVACGKPVFVWGMVAAVTLCDAALAVRSSRPARLLVPALPLLLHPGHHFSSVIPGLDPGIHAAGTGRTAKAAHCREIEVRVLGCGSQGQALG
ncbi:hypothetical protein REMIM1_CH01049 [Rhizobium etli bv. mimosae str. Mim1]|nr:hypothetical protein REMIM1_CH01049 [Rhizobium etli bv. mimosae str. Mim1]